MPHRESFYTESSVPSTVWGPGTLAGRAILALGEATLKGLNRIVDRETRAIQKRIDAIRASVPHLAPEMYSDLIELSRPDLYPQYILEVATDILFTQLDLGYAGAIALSISQLSLSEAGLVIFRMFTSRDFELLDETVSARTNSPRKALDLLAMIVQVRPEMRDACFDVLDALFLNPKLCMHLFCFRNHPILRIHAEDSLHIPQMCRTPFAELQLSFTQDRMHRWKSWKLLQSAGYSPEIRLLQLSTVLLAAVEEEWYSTPEFFDAAVDLFDFLCYSQVPELRSAAKDQLVLCITLTRDSWEPLRRALDFVSHVGGHGTSQYLFGYPTLTARLGYGQYFELHLNPDPTSPVSPVSFTESASDFHPQLFEFLCHAHSGAQTSPASNIVDDHRSFSSTAEEVLAISRNSPDTAASHKRHLRTQRTPLAPINETEESMIVGQDEYEGGEDDDEEDALNDLKKLQQIIHELKLKPRSVLKRLPAMPMIPRPK
ncbi:hypothetical protein C8R43DRAFT_1238992 [Mycena crocata]|nr:hypothetical protein C8R43DRAFT_1238992 [Mycena crocata]